MLEPAGNIENTHMAQRVRNKAKSDDRAREEGKVDFETWLITRNLDFWKQKAFFSTVY